MVQNHQLLVDIVKHLPVGLVVWTLDDLNDLNTFRLVEVNPLAQQILGLSEQSYLPNETGDPFPAFLKIEVPDVYAKVIRLGVVEDLGEIRYHDRYSHEKIYTLKAFPLPPQRVGVVFEDVSDRRQAEESLRQSKQRLAFHVEKTPLAFIERNLKAEIIEWNPAAEKIFGYSKSEILGQQSNKLVPPSVNAQLEMSWSALLSNKGGIRSTSLNLTKDKKIITCEWYNTPLVDEDGNVVGVASLVQDITERQQHQSTITASEVRYRRLFETAQDGILLLNAETGQINDANPFLVKLLGYPYEELLGKKLWEIGLTQDIEATQSVFQTLQTEGYVRYEDLSLKTKTGQHIEVEFVGSLYQVNDRQVIQCNVRDITERKRLESELRQFATRLEQSNRELQDFASVASHDLQEPLRKIQAFGDRLNAKCSDSLSQEGQDYLRRMQNAALRMQTLINDLLAFSRVTTKAQPFVKVDLAIVVRDVLLDLEIHIQKVKAQVNYFDLPTIEADPLQMRQLMQNLISNALKFHSETPPTISINGRMLKATAGKQCEITVADNGIGFDEKYLDRIFTVFQRLHGRNEYEGTGIGLAICRRIVERHNGTITAKSKPNEGTTFIVTLPVQQPNSDIPL